VTRGRRLAALVLLAAALALAALGQDYFTRRRDYLWDGLAFYGLAVLCFVLAWRYATGKSGKVRPTSGWSSPLGTWLRTYPGPTGLVVLGLALSGVATLLSLGREWNQATYDIVIVWLLGVGCVVVAALWPAMWPLRIDWQWNSRLAEVKRETWLELAVVVGLTAAALMLRVTALDSVPYTLSGDEAWFGLTARQVITGELRNPFVTAHVSMPTFFYWPISWAMRLVENGMIGLRLPSALVGTATVPALYLLARHMWGRRMAFLSAAFLAAYDYHIHYSRLGTNNVWDALFAVLTFWALDVGLTAPDEARRRRALILAGLVMGFSAYFYTGARLLPVLVAAYLVYYWAQRRWQKSTAAQTGGPGWQLVLVPLAFLAAAGPMLAFSMTHPDDWNARINQVGIIQSGWLAREPGLTGKSTAKILAEQFLRAAGAFHVFADRTVWYGVDRPLLGFLAGICGVLGMAWAAIHWRERRYFLVLLWFWAAVITGGMLTESPPSSQRLVVVIPAAVLLVAIGVDQTVGLALGVLRSSGAGNGVSSLAEGQAEGRDDRGRWGSVVVCLVILGLAVSSVQYYFAEFTPSRRYGSRNGETATMIGHYLGGMEGDYHAYFLGAPLLYWRFGSTNFLAPDVTGEDIVEPLDAPPYDVETARTAVWICLPERIGELSWVQQAFPNGQLEEFRDARGELRFMVYTVQP
jgi:4-amino-4-deoxy-L-arabinose transferase-like glycosyltransferase